MTYGTVPTVVSETYGIMAEGCTLRKRLDIALEARLQYLMQTVKTARWHWLSAILIAAEVSADDVWYEIAVSQTSQRCEQTRRGPEIVGQDVCKSSVTACISSIMSAREEDT